MKHHAAIATHPSGKVAVAIAHMSPSGPVLDEIRELTVTGGESGIDAVYAGLRARGIEVSDERRHHADRGDNVRERAISDVFDLVRAS